MKFFNLKQLLPLIIIAIGIAIFFILKLTQPTAQPISIKARSWQVKTMTAKLQTLSPTLTLYGQIETPALVKAAAPNKSRVISVDVHEGDAIVKGQALLRLDPRDYQPLVQQADAKVSELRAIIASEKIQHKANQRALHHEQTLLELSEAAVSRAQQLKNKNLGSTAALEEVQQTLQRQQLAISNRQMLLDEHITTHQQLQARLQYAQAELELAQLNLERSQIDAPFDGYVEKLHVANGDQVKENQILISFYPLDQLEVRAKIPTAYQHEIQHWLSNHKNLTATAYLGENKLILQLNRVAGLADARGIDGLFKITKGNNLVRLGSTISLSLQRPTVENVVAIPFSALYDNNRIYKLINDHLQSIKVKQLGEHINGDQSVALLVASSEINSGDQIVITHLPNAINGLSVSTE